MLTLLLALTLTAHSLPEVEACEINHNPHLSQVVLYRWMRLPDGSGHRVAQWWTIHSEPVIARRGNRWIVASEGRRFVARSLSRTETISDPERLDLQRLPAEQRRPYFGDFSYDE
jgi:hypothetical protein